MNLKFKVGDVINIRVVMNDTAKFLIVGISNYNPKGTGYVDCYELFPKYLNSYGSVILREMGLYYHSKDDKRFDYVYVCETSHLDTLDVSYDEECL